MLLYHAYLELKPSMQYPGDHATSGFVCIGLATVVAILALVGVVRLYVGAPLGGWRSERIRQQIEASLDLGTHIKDEDQND